MFSLKFLEKENNFARQILQNVSKISVPVDFHLGISCFSVEKKIFWNF